MNQGCIDLGGETAQLSAIYDGRSLPYKYEILNYGGNAITDYLISMVGYSTNDISSLSFKSSINLLKEKACYVALDYKEELYSVDSYV